MPTSDVRSAYGLLRRAMQQQSLLQQIGNSGSVPMEMPGYGPKDDDGVQGGLLGRLLALQAERGHQPPFDEISGEVSPYPHDPNFRKLSRVQVRNQWEGLITPSVAQNGISRSSQLIPLRDTAGGPSGRHSSKLPELSAAPSILTNTRWSVDKYRLNSLGSGSNIQQFRMAGPTHSQCVDRCLHLLPSPSGDLQSSEFRKCVGKCMGRL